MDVIHCPFCGWHRIKDTKKGTPEVWDEEDVLRALAEHLGANHSDLTVRILRYLT